MSNETHTTVRELLEDIQEKLVTCADCGEGYVPQNAAGCPHCEDRRRRERERHQALRRQLRAIGLDADDVALLLHRRLKPTRALSVVRSWLESDVRILVLAGGVGCGKTIGACSALVELGGGEFVRASELAQRVNPWGDEAQRFAPLNLGAPLVVLDDLGVESASSRWSEAFDLFMQRRTQGRTIITTNLRKAEVRPRYGDRIADRLNHMGRAVEIADESLRRKGDL